MLKRVLDSFSMHKRVANSLLSMLCVGIEPVGMFTLLGRLLNIIRNDGSVCNERTPATAVEVLAAPCNLSWNLRKPCMHQG